MIEVNTAYNKGLRKGKLYLPWIGLLYSFIIKFIIYSLFSGEQNFLFCVNKRRVQSIYVEKITSVKCTPNYQRLLIKLPNTTRDYHDYQKIPENFKDYQNVSPRPTHNCQNLTETEQNN